MAKKQLDKTEKIKIVVSVFVVLVGMGLTATSLCVYYLVKPQSAVTLAILCVVDFLYSFFSSSMACKYLGKTDKWLLKGLILSVGYIVAFIVVAILFLTFGTAIEFLTNNIVGIVLYAFFTSPSMFLVGAILILCMASA